MSKVVNEERYATWFHEQVQIGIDQANAGKLVLDEEVEAYFAAKRVTSREKANLL